MQQREKIIHTWFEMWLKKESTGIEKIFTEDAIYIESWGPKYQGIKKIAHWFSEWNTRGNVLEWEIKQYFHFLDQTLVEWYFKADTKEEGIAAFDGISLIHWTKTDQICFLKEFACDVDNYDPYENGVEPVFR